MLYVSKTLAGGEQQLDVPEERIDTEGGFEYRKIFSLFKVVTPTQCPVCLYLKPKPASFLIVSPLYHSGRDVADSHPHDLEDFRRNHLQPCSCVHVIIYRHTCLQAIYF